MRIEWNPRAAIKKVGIELDRVSKESAKRIVAELKQVCPVDRTQKKDKWGNRPGSLRDSIRFEKSKFEGGGYVILIGGEGFWGDPFYASFVELGTPGQVYKFGKTRKGKKMKGEKREPVEAHPFVRPVLEKNRRRVAAEFKKALKRI